MEGYEKAGRNLNARITTFRNETEDVFRQVKEKVDEIEELTEDKVRLHEEDFMAAYHGHMKFVVN